MSGELASAFLVGLLGGVHCLGMCGGIVSAFSMRELPVAPPTRSLLQPFLRQLSWNSGRVLSYVVAGAMAGFAGSIGLLLDSILPAQTALYLAANVLLILLGMHMAGWTRILLRLEAAGAVVWKWLQSIGLRLAPAQGAVRSVGMGMLWGWIPCGMVYSVLVLALASGSAVQGALVMFAFGLGTLPNLLASGLAAQRIGNLRGMPWIRTLAGSVIVALGIAGLARVPIVGEIVRAGLKLCFG